MPSLFLSHGSPMVVLDGSAASQFFCTLADHWGRPRAIVVVSAHHEAHPVEITASPAPPTIHDFGRFDPRLFDLRFPAPGDPGLAQRCADLLAAAGIPSRLDPRRGYDHGAWTPLLLALPEATIPVIQVSQPQPSNPQRAAALGVALRPLLAEDVLVIGSGAVTHDLRRVMGRPLDAPTPPDTDRFADWIGTQVETGALATAQAYRSQHPDGVANHPSEEHLLPMFTAWAAGGGGVGRVLHRSAAYGALRMDAYGWA